MHTGSNRAGALCRAREAGLPVRGGSGFLLPQKCNGSAEELLAGSLIKES